jgi:hypothetical protein
LLWFSETRHKNPVPEVAAMGKALSRQIHDDMWRRHESEHYNVSEFEPVSYFIFSGILDYHFMLYHYSHVMYR